jgi:hypothetical protein
MKTNIDSNKLQEIVKKVSDNLYEGNVIFNRFDPNGKWVNFTLRVQSSKSAGHRLSHSGRRLVSACFHVHYDVMKELFEQFPDARIVTCHADYRGKSDFEKKWSSVGYKNIGSIMQPMCFEEACEC